MVTDEYDDGGVPDTRPENPLCDSAMTANLPAIIAPCGLLLTQEEALGLLELAFLAPSALTSPQQAAIEKLGLLCRELAR